MSCRTHSRLFSGASNHHGFNPGGSHCATDRATRPSQAARRGLLACSLGLSVLLAACGSTPPPTPERAPERTETTELAVDSSSLAQIRRYLALADNSEGADADQYRLQASRMALEQQEYERADAILAQLEAEATDSVPVQTEIGLQRATLALARNDAPYALVTLNGAPFDRPEQLPVADRMQANTLRADAYVAMEQHLAAARELARLTGTLTGMERQVNNNRIWQILSAAPINQLEAPGRLVDSYELRGWLELVNTVNASQNNLEQQVDGIDRWQGRWNQHSAADQLPDALAFVVQLLQNRPAHIALILPLADAAGRAVSDGFMAAYYEARSQGQPVPEVLMLDSTGVRDIMPLYQRAVEAGVDLIVGPLQKDAVRQLQNMSQLPIPTLALNYGDEGRLNPAQLYQFGLAPEHEIQQAARMAWQAGHRYAAVLTPAGEEYERIQASFTDYWQALGGTVVSSATFGPQSTYSDVVRRLMSIDTSEARAMQLRNTLPRSNIQFTPRRRQDVDFVFVLANPGEGRQLKPTFAFHFAGDVPVYAMPAIYDGTDNSTANRDLHGIVFVDAPWLLAETDPLRGQAASVWPEASAPVSRLRAMGVDAFRLHARLSQLASFPGLSLQGATGVLSMQDDGTIVRELLGAEFINGEVQLLAAEHAEGNNTPTP